MHENEIFRWFTCGLSREQTAELCCKTVRTVTGWDTGNPIPPECRKLMMIHKGLDLTPISPSWNGWRIKGNVLIAPNGEDMSEERLMVLALRQQEAKLADRQRPFAWYWEKRRIR